MTKSSLSHIFWFYNSIEQTGQKPSLREESKSPKYESKDKTAKRSQSKD